MNGGEVQKRQDTERGDQNKNQELGNQRCCLRLADFICSTFVNSTMKEKMELHETRGLICVMMTHIKKLLKNEIKLNEKMSKVDSKYQRFQHFQIARYCLLLTYTKNCNNFYLRVDGALLLLCLSQCIYVRAL